MRYALPALALSLAVAAAGCGDDNPAGPSAAGETGVRLRTFQAAHRVIGQTDFVSGLPNAGGSLGPVGLVLPLAAGSGSFYLPDALNHRVLGFGELPTADGAAADFVVGQPDFTSGSFGSSGASLNTPSHCVAAGGKLFVADLQNQRVLIWNRLPTGNTPADVAVGQPDLVSHVPAAGSAGMNAPFRVAVSGNRLFVADNGNGRVLIWNSIPTHHGAPADVVLGKPDFTTAQSTLSASGMDAPAGLWTDGVRLVVTDQSYQRVLIWSSLPVASGTPADVVVGAPDFTTPGSSVPSATSVGFPAGVASDGARLFVADTANNRVLVFDPFPTANGASATAVLGQGDFQHGIFNDDDQDGMTDGGPTARTLSGPSDVAVIGDELLVADTENHRILVFASEAL